MAAMLFCAASCSSGADRAIHIGQLEGLCYAPRSIVFNGALSLDGFDGVDRWMVVPADPADVAGLDGILSSKRVTIGSGEMVLSVPRDAVVKRPFNVQFVAFPCDAPPAVKRDIRQVHIVSIAADLPLLANRADATSDRSRDDGIMPPR